MTRHFMMFVSAAAVWLATLSIATSSSTLPLSTSTSTSTSKTPPKPSSSSKCYYPNGKPEQTFAYDYEPCGGKNTTWHQCCIPGQDTCTENGLCTHLTNAVGAFDYRGGCTSADWTGCPQVCLDVLSNSWLQVKQCASGEYCCNPDFDHGDCCRDGSRRFSLLDRNPDASGNDTAGKTNGTDASGGSGGDNTAQTDGGKGSGPKVGAAVGGALGGIAVIGGAVGGWLMVKRRKMRKDKGARGVRDGAEAGSPGTVESLGMKQAYVPVSEAGAGSVVRQAYTPISEAEGRPVMEMDSRGVHELGG